MLSSLKTIFSASVIGSLELFMLCATGAFLYNKNIFTRVVCRSLSRAILNAFLPALLFGSIVHTVYSLRDQENAIYVMLTPPLLGLFTQSIGLMLGLAIVKIYGNDLDPMVKRACVLCVCFGNSNTLPILMMHALCESFAPLAESAGGVQLCRTRSTGFCSLFLITWSTLFWSFGLRYLIGQDSEEDDQDLKLEDKEACEGGSDEDHALIASGESGEHPEELTSKLDEGTPPPIPGLLTPPVVAILFAIVIGYIPTLSDILVSYEGPVQSLRLTLKLLGNTAIPMSAMIVGAKLLAHARNSSGPPVSPRIIVAIVVGRLVFFPAVGLLIYLLVRRHLPTDDPLVHLVLLTEFNTPTANNNMIVAQIASIYKPDSGRSVESTVATLIFWQYLLVPIMLSANTATFLQVIFGTTSDFSLRGELLQPS